jgi:hypothetical protein
MRETSSWSASLPSATYVAAWRLMTARLPRFASRRSCGPRLLLVTRMSRLKKLVGNSTSIARRAYPWWTRRAVAAAQSAFTVLRGRRATRASWPLTRAARRPLGASRPRASNPARRARRRYRQMLFTETGCRATGSTATRTWPGQHGCHAEDARPGDRRTDRDGARDRHRHRRRPAGGQGQEGQGDAVARPKGRNGRRRHQRRSGAHSGRLVGTWTAPA